jgi:hypothetical protein
MNNQSTVSAVASALRPATFTWVNVKGSVIDHASLLERRRRFQAPISWEVHSSFYRRKTDKFKTATQQASQLLVKGREKPTATRKTRRLSAVIYRVRPSRKQGTGSGLKFFCYKHACDTARRTAVSDPSLGPFQVVALLSPRG